MIRRRSRQSLGQALAFALEGLRHAVRTQRAFRIQLVITGFVGGLLLWLGVPALEAGVIILSNLVVLVVELINTALEVVVDLLVERNHHALAKVAKDLAAAAVVVAAAGAAIVGLLVLGPPVGAAPHLGGRVSVPCSACWSARRSSGSPRSPPAPRARHRIAPGDRAGIPQCTYQRLSQDV